MTKKLIINLFLILFACSLVDDTSNQNRPENFRKLQTRRIPENCDYEKLYVFKVVCDQYNNVFGIDQSFVEGICQSEINLLEGMQVKDAYDFIDGRLDYFNTNWLELKEQSTYPFVRSGQNVQITAMVKNMFSETVVCVLNNGADRIEVNAEVVPDCVGSTPNIYNHDKCGVRVLNLNITNNNYKIDGIRLQREGTLDKNIAYRFTSGYIYQGFSGRNSGGKALALVKDTRGILDRYR